jgi:hypothetical protein
MARHSNRRSLWDRFLRWLLPANGAHARAQETGELPVYEDEETGYAPEGYDEWSPDDEPDGGPFFDPRQTRADYSIEHYYRDYQPSVYASPLTRPYIKAA